MEGIVFDLQKFALHDGPGIRTAVFLKGCPLRCVWCCNPESQKLQPQLSFEKSKCSVCGRCIRTCPLAVMGEENETLSVDFNSCSACGDCVNDCSEGALRVYGYPATADAIVKEVIKDKPYFENSGGGITLSGGEAMAQFDFTLEILQISKENGLHTAIETSGYASASKYEQILPFVDLFLYDYKHTGNEMHKKYTGVEQDLILENLDLLYTSKANILVRCPIIPGINDTEEHFKGITALSNKYPDIKGIEILGYHDYGMWKYENLGMSAFPISAKTVSHETVGNWTKQLKDSGCNIYIPKN